MRLDDVYAELIALMMDVAALPEEPAEAEEFLSKYVESFDGSKEELLADLRERTKGWFRSLVSPPRWIHNPAWQFLEGRPMWFVGQIDVPRGAGAFHDEASVFVFIAPDSYSTKVVVQVA